MKLMSELGWQVYGTDLSSSAAKISKRQWGLDIFVGDILENGSHFPREYFNLITLRHVIEHVPKTGKLLDLTIPSPIMAVKSAH